MSDLIAWLRGCLDDDERVARAAASGPARAAWTYIEDDRALPYVVSAHPGSDRRTVAHPEELEYGPHIARHDPARVLARVAADRAILNLHSTPHTVVDGFCVEDDGPCTHSGEAECTICGQTPCDTVLTVLQSYAGRDGWREEWRTDPVG